MLLTHTLTQPASLERCQAPASSTQDWSSHTHIRNTESAFFPRTDARMRLSLTRNTVHASLDSRALSGIIAIPLSH